MTDSVAFIGAKEASRITGLPVKALVKLAKQGAIGTHAQGGADEAAWQFARKDIERLGRLRKQGKSINCIYETATTGFLIAKQLQSRVQQLELALGVTTAPADLTPEGVLAIYEEATELGLRITARPSDLYHWGTRLLSMDEAFLEAVHAHVADAEPWFVFMATADTLTTYARKHRADPLWKAASYWLQAGKNHLRNVSYFYAKAHGGGKGKNPPHQEDVELLALLGILKED